MCICRLVPEILKTSHLLLLVTKLIRKVSAEYQRRKQLSGANQKVSSLFCSGHFSCVFYFLVGAFSSCNVFVSYYLCLLCQVLSQYPILRPLPKKRLRWKQHFLKAPRWPSAKNNPRFLLVNKATQLSY